MHEFLRYSEQSTLNLIGKTSLVELSKVIYYGDFMLSNETLAPFCGCSANEAYFCNL